jgi:hypothetical protein
METWLNRGPKCVEILWKSFEILRFVKIQENPRSLSIAWGEIPGTFTDKEQKPGRIASAKKKIPMKI